MTIATEGKAFDLLALDHALTELSRVDPRQAQVIELRYFGGLTIDELAGTLGVSTGDPPRATRGGSLAQLRDVEGDVAGGC